MKLAILSDYENVASRLADWHSLEMEIDVYSDYLREGEALVRRLIPYDILIIMRERVPFPRSLVERLPNLKLLVTTGAKNRSIDLHACREREIVVCGTESSRTAPAELTWALILAVVRQIPQYDRTVREGKWVWDSIGSGLEGKTLGILGLGKLGTQVARIGHAFGMNVIAWSQNLTPEAASSGGAVYVEKDKLFAMSDIVSVHLILSERTRGLVGRREIELMKPSAYIINTSRGAIIEENALIDALRNNTIAGAGLDVFEAEPLPETHPFLSLSNTVLTPHIGYVMEEGFRTYFTQAKEDVAAWLNDRPIRLLEE